jgi:hypothetical protein
MKVVAKRKGKGTIDDPYYPDVDSPRMKVCVEGDKVFYCECIGGNLDGLDRWEYGADGEIVVVRTITAKPKKTATRKPRKKKTAKKAVK